MERLTAGEAEVLARRAAASLRRLGVRRGERVVILVPAPGDHADESARLAAAGIQRDVMALAFGALRAGIVPVMINPALTPDEREPLVADASASMVIDHPAKLRALLDGTSGEDEIGELPLARPVHYTSGTTGRAKGVWTGLLSEDDARLVWWDDIDAWQLSEDDVMLTHGPLAHSAPLRFSLATLLAGGTVILPGWFDATAFARALAEERPTVAFAVPTHLQRLFALPGGVPSSPYRLLIHAGSACPPSLKRRIHEWAGVERTVEFYGATEGQFSLCRGEEWEERPGTVGRARAGRRLRVDDGVIWCAPPSWSTFEYWGDPVKTAAAWRTGADGAPEFSVGDLGYLDDDGYLFLRGRRDDLVISGGVNVYPDEVEAVLLSCPGVEQVAVFGVTDEKWGQRVCAGVVGSATEGEVRAWAEQRLAGYKRPKEYYRLEDLPRTESGKVRRLAIPGTLGLE